MQNHTQTNNRAPISSHSHKPLYKPTSHENVMAMVTWWRRKRGAQARGGRDKVKHNDSRKEDTIIYRYIIVYILYTPRRGKFLMV